MQNLSHTLFENSFLENIQRAEYQRYMPRVLLAVSGGADSMVMVELFRKSGIKIAIAHCNFKLRKEESDADEAFVREYAEGNGIQIFVKAFETAKLAKSSGKGVQETARDLRYAWFEELIEVHGFSSVATAHNSDDSVETFIFNAIRGCGIKGLSGIPAIRGKIFRPLLFASALQIRDYAKSQGLLFRSDSSNVDAKYSRNSIRHNVLPILEKVRPGAKEGVLQTIKTILETEMLYEQAIAEKRNKIIKHQRNKLFISYSDLYALNPCQTWLFEILKPYGFHPDVVTDIVQGIGGQPGKHYTSATHILYRERKGLVIKKIAEGGRIPVKSETPELYLLSEDGLDERCPIRITLKHVDVPSDEQRNAGKNVAYIDAQELNFPLIVRRWMQADYFYPLGLGKKKKIGRFFINSKVPVFEKQEIWLVLSGNNVVWVSGMRLDHRFRVTEKTKRVVKLELLP